MRVDQPEGYFCSSCRGFEMAGMEEFSHAKGERRSRNKKPNDWKLAYYSGHAKLLLHSPARGGLLANKDKIQRKT